MLLQHLLARLAELGAYAHDRSVVMGLSDLQAGALVLGGAALALAAGALLASRLVAPSDAGHAFGIAVAWVVCTAAWDAARALGHVSGPGPEAALAAFFLGLMVSAAHVVLETSWPRGVLVLALGWGFGGLIFLLFAQGARLMNAI